MPRFDYHEPHQTAKAKVQLLRDVVHGYKGVIELPWQYDINNAHHTDRAEVEALTALIAIITGDGLPEYLDPKPEPVEDTSDPAKNGEPELPEGEKLSVGGHVPPPAVIEKVEGVERLSEELKAGALPDAGQVEKLFEELGEGVTKLQEELGDSAEVKATEDPGVVEVVPGEGVEAVVDESGDVTLKNQAGETISGEDEVPSESPKG